MLGLVALTRPSTSAWAGRLLWGMPQKLRSRRAETGGGRGRRARTYTVRGY